jgi:hypothetical protein
VRRLQPGMFRLWYRGAAVLMIMTTLHLRSLAAQENRSVRLVIVLARDSAPSGSRVPIVRSENLLSGNSRWLSA